MKRRLPPNDVLVSDYKNGLSIQAIAKKYSSSFTAVLYNLKKANCEMRTLSQAHVLAYKKGRQKVISFSGENHWNWKGGSESRGYRKVIKKELCARCGATKNLGIHHIDLDHYNNEPENLQVLCVSCHMSLHKQAYWDAVHAGQETPKSNGPIGWSGDEKV
jgi:hypothetical protein